MDERHDSNSPVTVFYSYAHEDERLRRKLEKHLSLLRQQGMITEWYDRELLPGTDWAHIIDTHLITAQVILLLISPDFLASDYCYGIEIQRALERQATGEAQVIPILLRPVDWESAPFASLQYLPRDGRPITKWKNQDEALVEVAKGLRAAITQVRSAATLPLSPAPLVPRAPSLLKQQTQLFTASGDRNRQRLLKRMQAFWIQGGLERSLHRVALITLGLQEQPDALANPFRLIAQETARTAHPLPSGTRITQVYDEADGNLLILGEPGSGKTTLLLELARDLLHRAEQDENHPMPIVFNLSTWAVKQQPLTDWLAEELNLRYDVPSQLAMSWISTDRILPLLDGLDEVAPAHRVTCLKTINAYKGEHDLVSVVVCSRRKEYFSQATLIQLHNAVTVQPLTVQQIDEYLLSAGEQLTALRTLLHQDEVLLELATNPLMLSILTLTYHGKAIEELTINGSPDEQRQQIFAAYVQRMFERRGVEARYTSQQTIAWLQWLASRMAQSHQTEFYLESMQPEWVWEKRFRRYYDWTVGRPLVYILFALLHAVCSGLWAVLVVILVSTLALGINKAMLGTLIGIFPAAILISLVSGILYGWRKGLYTAAVGIPIGALSGALISNMTSGLDRPIIGLIIGLVTGAIIGLLASILGGKGYSGIFTAPRFAWSWEEVRLSFKRENKALQVASVLGGVSSILVGAVVSVEKGVFRGLGMGGVMFLASLLLFVLYRGVQSKSLSKQERIAPNQRIWLSARKGLYFCLIAGLSAFTGTWLIISSVAGSAMGWICALVAGALSGIVIGWASDWDACVRHLVLRVLLWRAGSLPGNYTRFLDYAADRILLQKIGGGYKFIHRFLQKYFALTEVETKRAQLVKPDATTYYNRGLVFAEFGEDEEAIMNYTRAIELDPKAVSVYCDRGLVYDRSEEYQQAIADYTHAIELDPKRAWVYRQRGGLYHKLEEYEKAIADFTQVIELEPKRTFLYYRDRAWSYRFNKEYEKALADYTRAMELAPQNAWFSEERGLVYDDLNEYEKALADFTRAMELNPQAARFCWRRGLVYIQLEKYEKAITDYTTAIELAPQEAWFHHHRGLAYASNNKYQEAVADYTSAIELEPKNASTYHQRGIAYRKLKEHEKAITDFTQAIKLKPERALTYRYRGWSYQDIKENEKALADFTHAIKLTPQEAWCYGNRSQIYIDLQEYEKAIADLSRAIDLVPQEAQFYRDRGSVYADLEKHKEAITDFTSAIELDPENAETYRQRGNAYHEINEYEKALADFTQAIKLEPEGAVIYIHRGEIYARNKEYQRAVADFTQAIEFAPEQMWLYGMRGSAYIQLEEYKHAITDFTRAIEGDPSDVSLYSRRGSAFLHISAYEQTIADCTRAIELNATHSNAYFYRGHAYLWLKKCELARADFVQYAALTPKSINAAWLVTYSNLGKQRPGSEIIEALEKIVAIEPQSGSAQFCRGVALGLENNYSDGIMQLEQAIQLGKLTRDAYFWKGLFCAYLGQDAEGTQAIMLALEAGLPPVLLTPLYWLEQERLEMYQAVAEPFLVRYDV